MFENLPPINRFIGHSHNRNLKRRIHFFILDLNQEIKETRPHGLTEIHFKKK